MKLVLASRDLDLGTILREGDIVLTDWPGKVPVPAGASSNMQDLVGRGVITKIYTQEPILEGRLAPKGAGGGFASIIPPGMRAVAVPINEVVGVAGFVLPGCTSMCSFQVLGLAGVEVLEPTPRPCCRILRRFTPARTSRRTLRDSRSQYRSATF